MSYVIVYQYTINITSVMRFEYIVRNHDVQYGNPKFKCGPLHFIYIPMYTVKPQD